MVPRPEKVGKGGTQGPELVGRDTREVEGGGAGAVSGQKTNEQIKEGTPERIATNPKCNPDVLLESEERATSSFLAI